jgi:hypothetical protein
MKHLDHQTGVRANRPTSKRSRRRFTSLLGWAGVISITALAGAGCGSSSSKTTPAGSEKSATPVVSASGVAAVPVQASDGTGQTRAASERGSATKIVTPPAESATRASRPKVPHSGAAPKITTGNRVHRPAPGTGGNAVNDDRPAGKASEADSGTNGPVNPCLVSRDQAEGFTGTSVARPKVAPLGPTCVYTAKGGKTVTVAVEMAVFSKLKPHLQRLSTYRLSGHAAYCGIYGAPITYVLLPNDRVLTISAPCDVGKKFASVALAKLSA